MDILNKEELRRQIREGKEILQKSRAKAHSFREGCVFCPLKRAQPWDTRG